MQTRRGPRAAQPAEIWLEVVDPGLNRENQTHRLARVKTSKKRRSRNAVASPEPPPLPRDAGVAQEPRYQAQLKGSARAAPQRRKRTGEKRSPAQPSLEREEERWNASPHSNPPTPSKRKPPTKKYQGAGTPMAQWPEKLRWSTVTASPRTAERPSG